MVIIVDGRPFQTKLTGIGKYVLTLLIEFETRYSNIEFVVISNRKIEIEFPLKNYTIIYDRSIYKYLKPMLWYLLFSNKMIKNVNADAFLAGASFVPLFLKNLKIINVIHDLNHIFAPETMSKLHYITYRLFFKRSLHSSNYIITNSVATQNKIVNIFGVKINEVINPFVDSKLFKKLDFNAIKTTLEKYNIIFPYLLSVGTFEPRKNIDKIIIAFLELKAEGKLNEHKLILVGKSGWKNKQIQDIIDLNKNDIIQLGYVPDDDLPKLYNGAKIFLFPSKYEGFGIPAREALYCGTNCIVSDIPELKEATNHQCIYINPDNINSLKNSIVKLL